MNCTESFYLLRRYLSNGEQNVGRNMNGKDHSGEVSGRNEEHAMDNGYRRMNSVHLLVCCRSKT